MDDLSNLNGFPKSLEEMGSCPLTTSRKRNKEMFDVGSGTGSQEGMQQ